MNTLIDNRTTCLYCQLEGVETPLVLAYNRPSCPIHSRSFVEAWAETVRAIRSPGIDLLNDKGRPTINGVRK